MMNVTVYMLLRIAQYDDECKGIHMLPKATFVYFIPVCMTAHKLGSKCSCDTFFVYLHKKRLMK